MTDLELLFEIEKFIDDTINEDPEKISSPKAFGQRLGELKILYQIKEKFIWRDNDFKKLMSFKKS